MKNPESKRPVTVEDLLRLKRAERPAPEFWTHFEQELRAKQLAAIVAKRPWWEMPRLFTSLKRYQLPLGAAAALSVAFISVHHYRVASPAPLPAVPSATSVEDFAAADSPTMSGRAAAMETVAEARELTAPVTVSGSDSSAGVVATNSNADAPTPAHLAEVMPWLGTSPAGDTEASSMQPVQSLVAVNLEMVKATHPELARKFLGRAAGLETSDLERKPAVDPFTRLRGPADIKRDRLLAKALPVSVNLSGNSGDRVVRRISEERLTEEISRISGAGDRLSLKF